MIPTRQTVLHDPANGLHGNCLSAVLASLLHLPIDEVPLFVTPDTWVKDLNAWLRPFGLAYCMVEDFDCHIDAYGIEGLWHEISGNTSRSKDVTHACVAKDGQVVFDPHPDDTGLTKITCHGFFIALEPWRILTHTGEVSGGADANRRAPAPELEQVAYMTKRGAVYAGTATDGVTPIYRLKMPNAEVSSTAVFGG